MLRSHTGGLLGAFSTRIPSGSDSVSWPEVAVSCAVKVPTSERPGANDRNGPCKLAKDGSPVAANVTGPEVLPTTSNSMVFVSPGRRRAVGIPSLLLPSVAPTCSLNWPDGAVPESQPKTTASEMRISRFIAPLGPERCSCEEPHATNSRRQCQGLDGHERFANDVARKRRGGRPESALRAHALAQGITPCGPCRGQKK